MSCTCTERTYALLVRRSACPSEAYTTARIASIASTPITISSTVPRSRAGAPRPPRSFRRQTRLELLERIVRTPAHYGVRRAPPHPPTYPPAPPSSPPRLHNSPINQN